MPEVTEGKVKPNGAPEQSEAIITTPVAGIVLPQNETAEQMLARAERSIAFRKGILKLIAANLEVSDVVLFGEGDKQTIHLTKHACKQILNWAGITVSPDSNIQEKRYEGTEGPYLDFEVWATWLTPDGRYYRAMGNRSTLDDFYAKRTKYACEACGADVEWENKKVYCKRGCQGDKPTRWKKTESYLPLTEVDIPSIKQAAITNLWNHVVEDAGLKPSRQELEGVGFKFADAAQVGFKSSSVGNPQATGQKPTTSAVATPKTTPQTATAEVSKPTTAKANPALKIGLGIISEVVKEVTKPNAAGKGGGKPFLKIVQNGHFLYCFDNKELDTGEGVTVRAFELIEHSVGQSCEFTIETKSKNGNPMHSVKGARRIGSYEWYDDGAPMERNEPGADPDENLPY